MARGGSGTGGAFRGKHGNLPFRGGRGGFKPRGGGRGGGAAGANGGKGVNIQTEDGGTAREAVPCLPGLDPALGGDQLRASTKKLQKADAPPLGLHFCTQRTMLSRTPKRATRLTSDLASSAGSMAPQRQDGSSTCTPSVSAPKRLQRKHTKSDTRYTSSGHSSCRPSSKTMRIRAARQLWTSTSSKKTVPCCACFAVPTREATQSTD